MIKRCQGVSLKFQGSAFARSVDFFLLMCVYEALKNTNNKTKHDEGSLWSGLALKSAGLFQQTVAHSQEQKRFQGRLAARPKKRFQHLIKRFVVKVGVKIWIPEI